MENNIKKYQKKKSLIGTICTCLVMSTFFLFFSTILVSANTSEVENNNTFGTANSLTLGVEMNGKISTTSDEDYFKFNVSNGQIINVSLSDIPSWCDYDIKLYNNTQTQVSYSNKSGNANEYIKHTATSSGTYYVRIYSYSGYSPYSSYALAVMKGDITTSNTNSSFSRSNAKWYAETYATWPGNTSYYNYYNIGGDCTNFASQVVRHGGMSMLGSPNPGNYSSWYYNGPNVPDRSYSWTSAQWFRTHWANNNNSGYNRAYRYRIYTVDTAIENFSTIFQELWEGDIVQHASRSDGVSYHSQIIHRYGYNSSNGVYDLFYAQHSTSSAGFYKDGSLYDYLVSRQNQGKGSDWFMTIRIRS